LDVRLTEERWLHIVEYQRELVNFHEDAAQNTLCIADNFFATFILVSRNYASNNALKDNLGLIFRYVFVICYVFGNMAYMLFLRFSLFKKRRSTGEGEGFHTTFEGKEGKSKQAES